MAMQLNKRFRRFVFAQILLGIVAFCIAERNPGMLLVAGALAVLSWYLTEGPTGRPLPRWLVNLLSLAAVGWLMVELFARTGKVVIAMGHFTMWLQVLLLYTDKSNREYGQLLVLSLMTMIGASILSVSMAYGLLLAAYCALGLVTLLYFHFKGTWDQVTDAMKAAGPADAVILPPKPTAGRGYGWHFRFTAIAVGFVCTSVAVAVFVATPRSESGGHRTDIQTPLTRKQTGFSETVKLGSGAPGPGSREAVLNMGVTLHGQAIHDPTVFLLRGAALDHYDPATRTWSRSFETTALDRSHELPDAGWHPVALPEEDMAAYEARITLREGGSRVLFAMQPTTFIDSQNFSSVIYNPLDGQLAVSEAVPGAVIYTIHWPLRADIALPSLSDEAVDAEDLPETERERRRQELRTKRSNQVAQNYARGWPEGDRQRIANYVDKILEPLRRRLSADEKLAPMTIAQAVAEHLQSGFAYSLDNPPAPAGIDPVADFLFTQQTGHCELFAAGFAAMLRSVGMQARVVTGYRVSEYNPIGGYYVVREDDAHAWTEVYLGAEHGGWRTFDTTPPAAVRAEHAVQSGWLVTVRQIYEAIEYEWVRSVVAYDQRTRAAVMEEIRSSVVEPGRGAGTLSQAWEIARNLRNLWADQKLNYTLIFVILITISLGVASLARTMVVRRRRIVALQLTAVPRARRRGLATRLRFYLTMLDMLERHGYVRPAWQSPYSFAQELAEANPMRFDPVISLTEMFYEIRFGHREIDPQRRGRIKAHLKQLEAALAVLGKHVIVSVKDAA